MNAGPGLRVLVIDDERPALDELTYLLERDHRIAQVHATGSPTEALRMLQQLEVDAVFLDIKMPGLTGIELAQVAGAPEIGNVEAGIVASLTSVRASIVSGGILTVVGTAVVAALLPALVRYDARRPQDE